MSLNFGKNCLSDILGTGDASCDKVMAVAVKYILVKRGWKIGVEEMLTQDVINQAICNGDWVVLRNHIGLEGQNKETVYTETSFGLDRRSRNPIYGVRIEYEGSLCYRKALKSLSGAKWDILVVDQNNDLYGEKTVDGYFKGFSTSLVEFDTFIDNDNTNAASEFLKIQFDTVGSLAMEERGDLLQVDVDLLNMNGVIQTVLTPSVTPITATPFEISAFESCNESVNIEGLELALKACQPDGTDIPITVTETSNGYTVDAGSYTGAAILKLQDETTGKNIAMIDNQGYKSSNTVNFTL